MAGHHNSAVGRGGIIVVVVCLVAACSGGTPAPAARDPVNTACDVFTAEDLGGFLGQTVTDHVVGDPVDELEPIVYLGVELSHCEFDWSAERGTIDVFLLTDEMADTMIDDVIAEACPGFVWGDARPAALFDCQNDHYRFGPGDSVLSFDRPADAVAAFLRQQSLDQHMVQVGQFGVTTDTATVWMYAKAYAPALDGVDSEALLRLIHERLSA